MANKSRLSKPSASDVAAFSRTYPLPFVERVFKELNPVIKLKKNWHQEALCYYLEQVAAGQITRLLVTMPPRMMKSTIVSIAFPAWLLGRDPTVKIIAASYGQDLADKLSNDTRRVIASAWYRRIFPGTEISGLKNSAGNFETTAGGARFATSVNGPISGFGADFIIIDDPEKPTEMGSEVTRQAAKDWFGNSVLTRLNDPATGSIIVVTHRLHEDDLSSLFLEQKGWVHLNLPAIAEADYEYPVSRNETHAFRRGEVLHPEHLPRETIEERRHTLGRAVFQAQYQQDPAPAGSSLSAWHLIRTVSEAPKTFDHIVQSWDLALTKSIEASYSACVTFGIIGPTAYVIDVERFKLEAPDLLTVINEKSRRWNPGAILIETSGVGQAVFQMLRRQKVDNLLWTKPTKDKLTRLLSIEDMLRAGRLVVVDSKAWFQSYRSEFISFPGGRFDDQVDATTQFMARLDRIIRMTIAIERKRKGETRYNHLIQAPRSPRDSAWSGEDVRIEHRDRYAERMRGWPGRRWD